MTIESEQTARAQGIARIQAFIRIANYAAEHTEDCFGDRSRALREMRDEPGEVAKACDCTPSDVISWIEVQE